MATTTTVAGRIELDGSSIGNVRKQLKEATQDLIAMQQQFGETSKEAFAAAKRVAELKDRMEEARETVDLFDPGKKFQAFSGVIEGVAHGFTAVQGAMGLFGVESKELEKQLLRVQSAMALSQGLSGILDAGKHFTRLAAIVRTQVVTAFSTLRGAIAATGIGLLISGVALLIENFDAVKKVIYDTFPALKGLFDNMDRIKQIARGVGEVIIRYVTGPMKAIIKIVQGDFKGAIEEAKGMFAITKNFREGEAKAIKAQAEERAAADAERLKKEKEKADKLKKQQEAAAKAAAEKRAAEIAKEKADYDKRNADRLAQERKLQDDINKILDGYQKSREDAEAKSAVQKLELQRQRALDELMQLGANATQLMAAQKYWDAQIEAQRETDRTAALQNVQKGADNTISILKNQVAKTNEQNKQSAQNVIDTEQAKQNMYIQTGNVLGQFSQLVGQQTAMGKALAVAQIAINTAIAISEAVKQATKNPLNLTPINLAIDIAARAATILGNIAAAKRILSRANVPGGGGGGNMAAIPTTAAPLQAGLSPQTQLQVQNQQAINAMGNQATRAYILNSDLQNNNQINAYLQRNATIG